MTVTRFRISMFWTASFGDLMADKPPSSASMNFLGQPETYASVFKSLGTGSRGPGNVLALPWPSDSTNLFWTRYLNASRTPQVQGDYAFYRLVPLRRASAPLPDKVLLRMLPNRPYTIETIAHEGWFHSHMVTFALHLTVRGSLKIPEFADACLSLRQDHVFQVPMTQRYGAVDDVAAHYLNGLFAEAIGEENVRALPPADPFTVVTVLQADPQADMELVEGGDLHLALEKVTRWKEREKGQISDSLITSKLFDQSRPVMFGQARSRVIWDPSRFGTPGISSLGCYHRNTFVGALQAEALLSFVQIANDEALAGRRPKSIRACEDSVLHRIVALHKGEGTYRSMSLRRFIDSHPQRASVNKVADRLWSETKLP